MKSLQTERGCDWIPEQEGELGKRIFVYTWQVPKEKWREGLCLRLCLCVWNVRIVWVGLSNCFFFVKLRYHHHLHTKLLFCLDYLCLSSFTIHTAYCIEPKVFKYVVSTIPSREERETQRLQSCLISRKQTIGQGTYVGIRKLHSRASNELRGKGSETLHMHGGKINSSTPMINKGNSSDRLRNAPLNNAVQVCACTTNSCHENLLERSHGLSSCMCKIIICGSSFKSS